MDSQGKMKRKGEKGVDKGKVRQTDRREAGWGLAEYMRQDGDMHTRGRIRIFCTKCGQNADAVYMWRICRVILHITQARNTRN